MNICDNLSKNIPETSYIKEGKEIGSKESTTTKLQQKVQVHEKLDLEVCGKSVFGTSTTLENNELTPKRNEPVINYSNQEKETKCSLNSMTENINKDKKVSSTHQEFISDEIIIKRFSNVNLAENSINEAKFAEEEFKVTTQNVKQQDCDDKENTIYGLSQNNLGSIPKDISNDVHNVLASCKQDEKCYPQDITLKSEEFPGNDLSTTSSMVKACNNCPQSNISNEPVLNQTPDNNCGDSMDIEDTLTKKGEIEINKNEEEETESIEDIQQKTSETLHHQSFSASGSSSENSSSSSESSSESESSSSSEDSDAEEDQTEIQLRNKLLQRRQELLKRNFEVSLTENKLKHDESESDTNPKHSDAKESSKISCREVLSELNDEETITAPNRELCPLKVEETTTANDANFLKSDANEQIKRTSEIQQPTKNLSSFEMNQQNLNLEKCNENFENEPCEMKELNVSYNNFEETSAEGDRKVPVVSEENVTNRSEVNMAVSPVQIVPKTSQNIVTSTNSIKSPSKTLKISPKLYHCSSPSKTKVSSQLNLSNPVLSPKSSLEESKGNLMKYLQSEFKKKCTSVRLVTNHLSRTVEKAASEDRECQELFTLIWKLFSEIQTLRNKRKKMTSSLSVNLGYIDKLLKSLKNEASSLSNLEKIVKKIDFEDNTLLTNFGKIRKELDVEKFIKVSRDLNQKVRIYDAQEDVLSKAFAKPVLKASPKKYPDKFRLKNSDNQKKMFKIDNRFRKRVDGMDINNSKEIKEETRKTIVTSKTVYESVPTSSSKDEKQTTRKSETDKSSEDFGILCPYDLLGKCNDDQCVYRHTSTSDQVRADLHFLTSDSVHEDVKNEDLPVGESASEDYQEDPSVSSACALSRVRNFGPDLSDCGSSVNLEKNELDEVKDDFGNCDSSLEDARFNVDTEKTCSIFSLESTTECSTSPVPEASGSVSGENLSAVTSNILVERATSSERVVKMEEDVEALSSQNIVVCASSSEVRITLSECDTNAGRNKFDSVDESEKDVSSSSSEKVGEDVGTEPWVEGSRCEVVISEVVETSDIINTTSEETNLVPENSVGTSFSGNNPTVRRGRKRKVNFGTKTVKVGKRNCKPAPTAITESLDNDECSDSAKSWTNDVSDHETPLIDSSIERNRTPEEASVSKRRERPPQKPKSSPRVLRSSGRIKSRRAKTISTNTPLARKQ